MWRYGCFMLTWLKSWYQDRKHQRSVQRSIVSIKKLDQLSKHERDNILRWLRLLTCERKFSYSAVHLENKEMQVVVFDEDVGHESFAIPYRVWVKLVDFKLIKPRSKFISLTSVGQLVLETYALCGELDLNQ